MNRRDSNAETSYYRAVTTPDLNALRAGDPAAWDAAFQWLWPTAFAAARPSLERYLPAEIEDVAIEAFEELIEKVHSVEGIEELKPLVARIAHNHAVDRLRKHFSQKGGKGQI